MRANLLHLGGSQLQRVYNSLPDVDKISLVATKPNFYDTAVNKLQEYFEPGRQCVLGRRRLRTITQEKNERFAHFLLRLRQQLPDCGLDQYSIEVQEVLTEILLIDAIIEGCSSDELRRRILQKDRALVEIEEIGSMLENVEQQVKDFGQMSSEKQPEKVFQVETKQFKKSTPFNSRNANWQRGAKCFNCGVQGHISSSVNCKARNQKCRRCDVVGHFESVCRERKRGNSDWKPNKIKRVRMLEQPEPEIPETGRGKEVRYMQQKGIDNEESNKRFYCFHLGNDSNVLDCKIGGVVIRMLVDSGSDINLIDQGTWEFMKCQQVKVQEMIKGCKQVVKAYGQDKPLPILGTFKGFIEIGTKSTYASFSVVEGGQRCLLGDATAKQLGVLKVGVDVNQLDSKPVFAKIKDIQVNIHMDPSMKPVFQPVRRIPIPYEEAVNRKLNQLLENDIIEVKKGPASWVSPLVVVGKANGEPRVCLDLRRVNEAVMRERYPMPMVDEILARIGKGAVRSRLDIREAFLQTELAPDSRDITTFITSRGLFRFKRLPFGLVSAPEIFQRVMEEILAGCEGTVVYLDDIYIEGKTREEHDQRLKIVLHRLNERGVALNKEKCVIGQPEVLFLGHVISAEGIRPSPSKVESLLSFRAPVNVNEVKSFLGLANYLNKYIHNLADLDEPLRRLTQTDVKFEWKDEQQTSFENIKKALANTPQLGYFNVKHQTSVIVDASPTALGAVLVQTSNNENRVVCYASKSLTDTEKRYCQTEKEALAAVWAVERFQMYLLGLKFDLVTDCKALQYLFIPRSKPCARIERWVLRLQGFTYSVKHIAGPKNIADVLSRLTTLEPKPFDHSEELFVQEIAAAAATNAALRWEEVEQVSAQDDDIKQVLDALRNDKVHELPVCLRTVANELCQVGNILMRGDRIVVPSSLRQRVLTIAHEGHPGVRMMKSHLWASVWWPKLDQDVENYVKRCRGCALVAAPNPPEPMSRRDLPSGPWEDLAIDFLGPLPEGQYLFVVVDFYSRYFEVCEMKTISAESTIQELTTMFSRFGVPLTLTADNAPQLSKDCEEFARFCSDYGIKLVNTIPYWPQMNGEVERQNRTILKRLKIAQELGQNWRNELQKFLLTYRSSTHTTTGRSPAELMFGHRIRTKLPQISTSTVEDEAMRDFDRVNKEKGKQYSDNRRGAQESGIKEGDLVLMKRAKKDNKLSTEYVNEPFVVKSKVGADTNIESVETGRKFRRNAAHLKKLMDTTEVVNERDRHNERDPLELPQCSTFLSGTVDHRVADTQQDSEQAEPSKGRKRKEPSWFDDYVTHFIKKG
ncbi:uncharacterized protein K02A2.6-like [Uranotaenia lowii]|uniref:uncharacterized protein K02A2.6-like n=1 Tax=Uranotaenia lowii TaxID=190385 RepID=UPI00247A06EA|nr:uncharacterized protein K02A2.6-like [Uranotaenia lowii]